MFLFLLFLFSAVRFWRVLSLVPFFPLFLLDGVWDRWKPSPSSSLSLEFQTPAKKNDGFVAKFKWARTLLQRIPLFKREGSTTRLFLFLFLFFLSCNVKYCDLYAVNEKLGSGFCCRNWNIWILLGKTGIGFVCLAGKKERWVFVLNGGNGFGFFYFQS